MISGAQKEILLKDDELKRYGLVALGIAICGITLTIGVQAAYLITALAGTIAAISYPNKIEDWFNTHRMLLIGAAIGFFVGGAALGPITMVLGGFLGHLIEKPVNAAVNVANKTASAYNTVSNLPSNIWQGLKSGLEHLNSSEKNKAPILIQEPQPEQATETPLATPSQGMTTPKIMQANNQSTQKKRIRAHRQPTIKPLTLDIKPVKRKTSERLAKKQENEAITAIAPPAEAISANAEPIAAKSLWQSFTSYFTTQPLVPSIENDVTIKPLTWQQEQQSLQKDEKVKETPAVTQPRNKYVITLF